VVFDKTGTLTKGTPQVTAVHLLPVPQTVDLTSRSSKGDKGRKWSMVVGVLPACALDNLPKQQRQQR
jgi:magnesium-transporting ATPase (P-type)